MTKINLRSYQQRAYDKVLWFFDHGGQKPFLHLFTGGGKAFLGLAIGLEVGGFNDNGTPKRVAFLAHSRELTDQPYNSLFRMKPSLHNKYYGQAPAAGIVRASRNQVDARFLFATMQTLAGSDGKRLDDVLRYGAFDLVIVDEAHHSAAKSYGDIIIPRFLDANPDTKILGMSATPARSDGKALDSYYDKIVFSMALDEGIRGGWLKPITAHTVQTDVSLGNISRRQDGTDFNEEDLRNALHVQNWAEVVGKAYLENDGPQRSTIGFMPSVEMGDELGAWFRNQGIKAASVSHKSIVDGKGEEFSGNGTYWSARDRVLNEFRQKDLQVLIGYSVLLEGFDARNTDMILQGRPTESMVLLTQLLGRGLRTPEGVSRLVRDEEHEKYLLQRDGEDDTWHEYAQNKLPFNPDCLVLDFTLKDTPVLLAGSLAGNKPPDVTELVEIDKAKIFETVDMPSTWDLIQKRGDGLKYTQRNFFRMSSDNWTYWDDATMSSYMGSAEGTANALFIYPSQKILVGRMDQLEQMFDYDNFEHGLSQDELAQLMRQVSFYRHMFGAFLLYQITGIPVSTSQKGEYTYEYPRWDSSKLNIRWIGQYADIYATWEAALPVSQRLSTGGFFVDKDRPGAANVASTAQLDLLYKKTTKGGRANIYSTLPAQINTALGTVEGLDLFRIEKPSRRSLEGAASSVDVSGMLNHVGIYSAVMRKMLGAQLVDAQRLYNRWSTLWQQQH